MEHDSSMARRHRGRVVSFDDVSGLGLIADDSGASHRFHCISIEDGSRTIEVGAHVTFGLVERHGDIEAASVAYADSNAQQ